jgi:hypothetical protein
MKWVRFVGRSETIAATVSKVNLLMRNNLKIESDIQENGFVWQKQRECAGRSVLKEAPVGPSRARRARRLRGRAFFAVKPPFLL